MPSVVGGFIADDNAALADESAVGDFDAGAYARDAFRSRMVIHGGEFGN